MSRHPSVKWAQRSDKIYVTIDLPDAKEVKLKLPDGKFFFSANKDGVPYEFDIELFDKVNVEESKCNIGVRSVVYVIKKVERKWWPRLIKQEGKPPVFLKVDWDKWVDEEDENEMAEMDFDHADFSNLDGDDFDMDDLKEDDFDMDDLKEDEDKIKSEEVESEAEAAETSGSVAEETKA
ncbi:HSP20-like chaperones superfamily protein [Quillaja saponaria]|uniref:Co-chaperone protein p23 n=1 Tax=Quillaja saponaria TaxID=32244 RepID=A0AAD7QJ40_QUISA|nr:HSP20-like chaperones superfamily protein [Quillaja saponaria]